MTNQSNTNSPHRRGVTAAGLGGLALASVLLLCGAGNAPIENFTPQGAMQADLNAGGHNVTNAANVSATNVAAAGLTATSASVGTLTATNVTVSGALTATNFTVPFANVSATPTTLAGYGITNAAVASGKTLTANNTLTLAGTDGSTLNVGAGGTLGSGAFSAASASVTGLRKSSGAGNTDTAAAASDIAGLLNGGSGAMNLGNFTLGLTSLNVGTPAANSSSASASANFNGVTSSYQDPSNTDKVTGGPVAMTGGTANGTSGAYSANGGSASVVGGQSVATATSSSLIGGTAYLTGGEANGASLGGSYGTGGAVYVTGGSAYNNTSNNGGGSVYIDGGVGSSGNGTVSIGPANAPAVSIGSSASTTQLYGTTKTTSTGTFSATCLQYIPTTVTGATTMLVGRSYLANSSSQLAMALPATAAVGNTVAIFGLGSGGWKITQASGQVIVAGTSTSTSGTSGYLAGTQYASATLMCIVANTTWEVTASGPGSLTNDGLTFN